MRTTRRFGQDGVVVLPEIEVTGDPTPSLMEKFEEQPVWVKGGLGAAVILGLAALFGRKGKR